MKSYRPTSKSRRFMTTLPYKALLSGDKPAKALLKSKKRQAGRNAFGRITTRHQGGGHKRRLREIDFVFDKKDIPAKIETIEYDPFRSAFIARVLYADGDRRYITAPKSAKVGDTLVVSKEAPVAAGNRLPLRAIPVGTFIYNIELKPGAGGVLARSAGNYAEVVAHDGGFAQLKLPSTEVRKVSDDCWASIGSVGNEEHNLVVIGKAGRSRWMGIRPTVRGTAMNPVDHPHGGGEGRQGRGLRRAKSLWGKPTGKGQKTRTPKKYSNVFIISRRRVGKKRSA
ncbi:50S ribosomal protein L2 [Candidatus Kaiserbacteria bacterium RIFCSPHIGHO2_12_FULL_56_13]|uniref:Large ribosomal subunit protein uL2 n=2 Tax=Candidatus Kaiseribacteriota TaxID=1752734 RepID=A0A1F6E214_9BACT|nr:MAG: 50S ribosomal protein L2 [Candidatus Kaiserbacteria bacterium RIFCSPHIGHO2_02_FULL_56_30]OGG72411.1 MAG: 50S ribosomal protein L2 [Candidatus Kaiserbacteria bacterium RIFCSPHIGHO2_12_FULL_56_13]